MAVPTIASGVRPVPPKYTAAAIAATAIRAHVTTSPAGGLLDISRYCMSSYRSTVTLSTTDHEEATEKTQRHRGKQKNLKKPKGDVFL